MHDLRNTDHDTQNKPTGDGESGQPDAADSSAEVNAPFASHEDDDSDFGDTDQHSTA